MFRRPSLLWRVKIMENLSRISLFTASFNERQNENVHSFSRSKQTFLPKLAAFVWLPCMRLNAQRSTPSCVWNSESIQYEINMKGNLFPSRKKKLQHAAFFKKFSQQKHSEERKPNQVSLLPWTHYKIKDHWLTVPIQRRWVHQRWICFMMRRLCEMLADESRAGASEASRRFLSTRSQSSSESPSTLHCFSLLLSFLAKWCSRRDTCSHLQTDGALVRCLREGLFNYRG